MTGTPTTQRRQLGRSLRQWRERCGLTLEQAGGKMAWTPHKLRQVELGRQTLPPESLDKLLAVLGVDDLAARDLRIIGEEARKRGDYGNAAAWARNALGLEADAPRLRMFGETVIPGLLQTEDYARALLRASAATPAVDVDRIARSRVRRRDRLATADAPALHVVLDEAALRRQVGGAEVMGGQLRLLADLAILPTVTLQVLPLSAGAHAAQGTGFMILTLDDPETTLVYAESLSGANYLDGGSHIELYEKAFDSLGAKALSVDETLSLLDRVLNKEGNAR